jgi:hypothetical protein
MRKVIRYIVIFLSSILAFIAIADAVFIIQDRASSYLMEVDKYHFNINGHFRAFGNINDMFYMSRKQPIVPIVPHHPKEVFVSFTTVKMPNDVPIRLLNKYSIENKPTNKNYHHLLIVGQTHALVISIWGTKEYCAELTSKVVQQAGSQGLLLGNYAECLDYLKTKASQAP